MKSNLYIVVKREYLERVGRKSFIITTILVPILMIGLMFIPALIMVFSSPEDKTIAVVDESGIIARNLESSQEIEFLIMSPQTNPDSLKNSSRYDGILVIGEDIIDNPGNVQLFVHGSPSINTEAAISNQIEDAIENARIKRFDIENLAQIMQEVKADVNITTYRISEEAEDEEISSGLSYFIGLMMSMILYMFLLLYGQMVMNSIIEEKNNRVLEIVVSSVRPQVLMMGKILGVCLVAVTQLFIWAVLIGCACSWGIPLISETASVDDPELITALGQLGNTGYILGLFGYIILFAIGGFILYASIFAVVGSAVDNVQDASQLSVIAMVPIMLGVFISMSTLTDPNSGLAFWASMIPFTSPMVMLARIPFGIAAWQIWVSLAILFISFVGMVWIAAKVYRVGIFMYGKKPNVKDLIRWARYK